jgi:hypothetical protein
VRLYPDDLPLNKEATMMKLTALAAALASGLALAAGCADQKCGVDDPCTSGPELLPHFDPPPPPDHGVQVIAPPFRGIRPGSDNEVCTWTDAIVDRDVDVRSTLGFQTEPGHHTIVYYTMTPQPPGTQRVCTDNDMTSLRYVAANAGNGVLNEAPGSLVYRIPKGSQIVINHHYLNASDEARDAQSGVNINFAEPGRPYTLSSTTTVLNTELAIQPGIQELSFSCTMDRELKLWYFAPHMHRWGTNIKIDVVKGGTAERLFDTNWQYEYTFHPPEKRFDPATPYVLSPGDQVNVHCTWNNDTPNVLTFGFEMCLAFGQFIDDARTGNWGCDNGRWGEF